MVIWAIHQPELVLSGSSRRSTSVRAFCIFTRRPACVNLQAFERQCTTRTWAISLVCRPLLWYILEKHVDVIRSFCSTLKSVNRGCRGGRDTRQLQERARKRDSGKEKRSEKRTSSRGHPNSICPLWDPPKQILLFNFYLLLVPLCCMEPVPWHSEAFSVHKATLCGLPTLTGVPLKRYCAKVKKNKDQTLYGREQIRGSTWLKLQKHVACNRLTFANNTRFPSTCSDTCSTRAE